MAIGAGKMGAIKVGGSLIGGTQQGAGLLRVLSSDPTTVTIGGSIVGGSGLQAGSLLFGAAKSVVIGGDVTGGYFQSGIVQGTSATSFRLVGDLVGGSISATAGPAFQSVDLTGSITFSGAVGTFSIGGSVYAGENNNVGSLTRSGSIDAARFGSIAITGSVIGSVGSGGVVVPVSITAKGSTETGNKLGIGKLTVGGSVEHANIAANYVVLPTPGASSTAGSGKIGTVVVGHDWIASNLLAGVQNLGADDAPGGTGANADNVNFGDGHDAFLANGENFSQIASITIGGQILGTSTAGDHFGFVAGKTGAFRVAGRTIAAPSATVASTTPLGIPGLVDDVSLHVL